MAITQRAARGDSGLVFDIQRHSLHDGPGIRTTVFLKGCPLRCVWCHSPKSVNGAPELRALGSRSIRSIRSDACRDASPTEASEAIGGETTVEALMDALAADLPSHDESGGGVTFSGGEPLHQWRFVIRAAGAARARGHHVAVDTSGYASKRMVNLVAEVTDLFLYHLKVMDPERHRQFTGVGLAPVLRNLRSLDAHGANVWIRLPLVPGHNDDDANLHAVGRFVAGLRRTRRLHVLPYQRLTTGGDVRLGPVDPMVEIPSPAPADIDRAVAVLTTYGLDVRVGG